MTNKLTLSRLHADSWTLHFKHPAHIANWLWEDAAPIEFRSCIFSLY